MTASVVVNPERCIPINKPHQSPPLPPAGSQFPGFYAMGSPNLSDIEAPSSPVRPEKSFVSNIDDGDTTMMDAATPEPGEKASRSKSKASQSKDAGSQSTIGKIRHLKKEDGDPLWRKDIQYDFLKAIFDDEKKVFTNSYEPDKIGKQCFADLYIDTMARSSKTSKVLRDKLLSDRDAAKGMAMVCLLVNIGRMNTTLNCKHHPLASECTSGLRFRCCFQTIRRYPFLVCLALHLLTCPVCLQSSPRCGPSYEHTMRFRPSKRARIPMPTSNCRMLPVSSLSSRVAWKTAKSPARS